MIVNRAVQRIRGIFLFAIAVGLLLSLSSSPTSASKTDVVWPDIELAEYINGLNQPVHISHAGDGSGRLFVVEQPGRIRIVENDTLQSTPFLDITDRVHYSGEQGLLSVAFPPDYETNGQFYVYYTNKNSDNQVSRFTVSENADFVDPNSETLILNIAHPGRDNHNGGQIAFGPDGYLYVGPGDGGGTGDPDDNGQDPTSLLGKILRIDVEFMTPTPSDAPYRMHMPIVFGSMDPKPTYRIPADNPFVDTPGYRDEIWALGLRNPWRFSFDSGTGDLYIADVGQFSYEEIDFQPTSSNGGENYGWHIMEGAHCYDSPTCDMSGLTLPVAEYAHTPDCSITGGHVYRGNQNTSMQGFYFFGDYCTGRIWAMIKDTGTWQIKDILNSPYSISTFGEDEMGGLYLADLDGGGIYKINETIP